MEVLDLTSVTRADSTLEQPKEFPLLTRPGNYLRIPGNYARIQLRSSYKLRNQLRSRRSFQRSYYFVYNYRRALLALQASKQAINSTLSLITCPHLLRFLILIGSPILTHFKKEALKNLIKNARNVEIQGLTRLKCEYYIVVIVQQVISRC